MLTKASVSVNIYPLVLCWCSTVVVQLICNQQVGGSNPSTSSKISYGGIPEWPKGADCKSVVNDFGGSNPPSPTKNTDCPSGRSVFLRLRWIRKAALSNSPVDCCNRRGFSAEKRIHLPRITKHLSSRFLFCATLRLSKSRVIVGKRVEKSPKGGARG